MLCTPLAAPASGTDHLAHCAETAGWRTALSFEQTLGHHTADGRGLGNDKVWGNHTIINVQELWSAIDVVRQKIEEIKCKASSRQGSNQRHLTTSPRNFNT